MVQQRMCELSKSLRKYSRNLSSNPFDRNTLNLFQKYRTRYKSVCRKAEKQYRRHLTDQRYWDIINKMNNWGKEKYGQRDHIEPPTWCKYYKSLLNSSSLSKEQSYTTEDINEIGNNSWNHETFDLTLDGRISTAEMSDALKQLKRNLLAQMEF